MTNEKSTTTPKSPGDTPSPSTTLSEDTPQLSLREEMNSLKEKLDLLERKVEETEKAMRSNRQALESNQKLLDRTRHMVEDNEALRDSNDAALDELSEMVKILHEPQHSSHTHSIRRTTARNVRAPGEMEQSREQKKRVQPVQVSSSKKRPGDTKDLYERPGKTPRLVTPPKLKSRI